MIKILYLLIRNTILVIRGLDYEENAHQSKKLLWNKKVRI